jgi:NitT/TauT family transport system substrate-binding protein
MHVRVAAVLASFALAGAAFAQAPQKLSFLTNWFAQAEHGGFYQAVAEGIYRKHGLDVTVRMGGPQVNGMQLLLAGQADLFMGYDIQVLLARQENLPLVTVAASFQKDPVVLIAHPDVKKIEDLKGRPVYISSASNTTFWPWLVARYGFTDDQKRPYSISVQTFLADRRSATRLCHVRAVPRRKGGREADRLPARRSGLPPYAQTIVATSYLAKNGDAVKRFVRATAEGYRSYFANPAPANALIGKRTPMTEDLLAFGVKSIQASRHRHRWRRREAGDHDHDRRALEADLRLHGEGRTAQGGRRLPEGVLARLRAGRQGPTVRAHRAVPAGTGRTTSARPGIASAASCRRPGSRP